MESRPRQNTGKQPAHPEPSLPLNQPPGNGSGMPVSGQNTPIPTQYRFRWERLPVILAHGPTELDDNLTFVAIDCSSPNTYIGAREAARLKLDPLPSIALGKVQTVKGSIECDQLVVEADISSRTLRIQRRRRHKISPHVIPDDDESLPLTIGRTDLAKFIRKERGFSNFCHRYLEGFGTMVREALLAPSDNQQYGFDSSIPPPNSHVQRTAAIQRYPNRHSFNTFGGPSQPSAGVMATYRGLRSQPQWQSPPSLREQHQMMASTGFAPEQAGAPDVSQMSSNDFSETPFRGPSENFNDYPFSSTSLGAPGDLLEAMSWGAQGTIVPRNDFNLQYGAHQGSQPGPSGGASDFLAGAGQDSQSQTLHCPLGGNSGSQTSLDNIEQQPSMGLPKHHKHRFD